MELVINALKYAFPKNHLNAEVIVRYEDVRAKLATCRFRQRRGKTAEPTAAAKSKGGLGTSPVNALAQQLEAQVETVSSGTGMSISVTRATFSSRTIE